MSESKYTPGPWCADNWATGYAVSAPESHYSVCRLEDCNNAHANAMLISAAPELLEACKTAMRHGRMGGILPESPVGLILTAAIAKAEGETHAS